MHPLSLRLSRILHGFEAEKFFVVFADRYDRAKRESALWKSFSLMKSRHCNRTHDSLLEVCREIVCSEFACHWRVSDDSRPSTTPHAVIISDYFFAIRGTRSSDRETLVSKSFNSAREKRFVVPQPF